MQIGQPFNALPINGDRKSAMTRQTENFGLGGAYLQFNFTCLSFQIHSHLTKPNNMVKEQRDVISLVGVFDEKYHRTFNSSPSSGQDSIKNVTDNWKI